MRKAVAVPYVIALILGVAVIALLGIWFVTSGGKFSGTAQQVSCANENVTFCTKWVNAGEGSEPSGFPAQCKKPTFLNCKTMLGIG